MAPKWLTYGMSTNLPRQILDYDCAMMKSESSNEVGQWRMCERPILISDLYMKHVIYNMFVLIFLWHDNKLQDSDS